VKPALLFQFPCHGQSRLLTSGSSSLSSGSMVEASGSSGASYGAANAYSYQYCGLRIEDFAVSGLTAIDDRGLIEDCGEQREEKREHLYPQLSVILN
jgi:hypothetical protein